MPGETAPDSRPIQVQWLGRLPYRDALALQEVRVRQRREGTVPDALLLVEHPAVITLGRGATADHVTAPAAELAARGIEIVECGRGGDVTYHGPGQLVGYPIVALHGRERDAHGYLRRLEQGLIDAVAHWGIEAVRVPGLTGIWVGTAKLAAIGVRLSSGWITSHGFALNVGSDLSGFEAIVPCGIRDRGVTSLSRLLGTDPGLPAVAARVGPALAAALERRPLEDDSAAFAPV